MHARTKAVWWFRWKLYLGLLIVFVLLSALPIVNADAVAGDNALLAEGKAEIDRYLASHGTAVLDRYRPAAGAAADSAGGSDAKVAREQSPAYKLFLFDVLNDNHPELFTRGKANAVTYYAVRTLGLKPDTQTHMVSLSGAKPSASSRDTSVSPTLWVGYNSSAAVSYALTWAYSPSETGRKRNSAYPNFSANDCTNFTSQVARAGGISIAGDGSSCGENNSSEWYTKKVWWSPCGAAWSYSWSVVGDFRNYMRSRVGAYVEAYPANREAVSLLISRARPGDFIQFDVWSGSYWQPTHGVAVVEYQYWLGGYYANDLRYNDHSGGSGGTDSYRRSLRAKLQQWQNESVTGSRRMVWIKMT